jgi:melibiose permease/lactose/raffinose/galactose permease
MAFMVLAGVGNLSAAQYNIHWNGKVYFLAPETWNVDETYKYIQVDITRTTNATSSNHQEYIGNMTRLGTSRLFYVSVNANHYNWNQNEFIAFTANDLSYWSLMPAITKDQKDRESIGAFARICANVGMFSMVLLFENVPKMFSAIGLDNKRDAYFVFAIITVLISWGFQLITLFGVKEDKNNYEVEERTTLRGMFKALIENDQLMVIAVAMALFMVGYSVTTSFGVYYFRYAFKNDDLYMSFCIVLAIAQLSALSLFPIFRKKFTRKQLYTGSMISVVVSYLLFFLSFENFALVVVAGLGLFFGQAFIQLLMLLFLADAIEYGEWKLGKRNEAVSFAVQPFINQFGGAVSKLMVTATLVISAINPIEDAIKNFAPNSAEKWAEVNKVTDGSVWIMKVSMMIIPLVLILVGFIIYHKKFKIDEKMYAEIVNDLEERKTK